MDLAGARIFYIRNVGAQNILFRSCLGCGNFIWMPQGLRKFYLYAYGAREILFGCLIGKGNLYQNLGAGYVYFGSCAVGLEIIYLDSAGVARKYFKSYQNRRARDILPGIFIWIPHRPGKFISESRCWKYLFWILRRGAGNNLFGFRRGRPEVF